MLHLLLVTSWHGNSSPILFFLLLLWKQRKNTKGSIGGETLTEGSNTLVQWLSRQYETQHTFLFQTGECVKVLGKGSFKSLLFNLVRIWREGGGEQWDGMY